MFEVGTEEPSGYGQPARGKPVSLDSAVRRARRGLIAAGFGADLRAAAATGRSLSGSTPEEQCALLAEIATYIEDRDPLMIGAAWLLEQSGFERTQLSLMAPIPQDDPEAVLWEEETDAGTRCIRDGKETAHGRWQHADTTKEGDDGC